MAVFRLRSMRRVARSVSSRSTSRPSRSSKPSPLASGRPRVVPEKRAISGDPGSRRVAVALAAYCGCWPCRDAGRVHHPGLARVHGGTEHRPARPLCALYAWGQGPEPVERDLQWLATESAAAALDGKGPDEALCGLRVRARRRSGRSSCRDACHLPARVKVGCEYGFGASWQHEISSQKAFMLDPDQLYPVCVAYQGDSPVEYLCEENRREPEPFSLTEVNRTLARLGR